MPTGFPFGKREPTRYQLLSHHPQPFGRQNEIAWNSNHHSLRCQSERTSLKDLIVIAHSSRDAPGHQQITGITFLCAPPPLPDCSSMIGSPIRGSLALAFSSWATHVPTNVDENFMPATAIQSLVGTQQSTLQLFTGQSPAKLVSRSA
ncbi:hypothetical protein PCANC_02716 [Puccinia coronata f. sp. avenae]|uniref:Uncharacterized protein n=1 Tax=Puccinia coronata f. sp. avenae TaxID=200324 RepID=A0A2N5SSE5_9BASI|nr:hypothetical protein PCASD_15854 [Puccinia coronata f. sp. avenae]PLW32753.1 hypothetical protein PCASD_12417 [Puccinia coronata f. sp. avenae]PLW54940.1 hypothetical protein PCANC_02716 [Puccinia coronata f. sp. avenae]